MAKRPANPQTFVQQSRAVSAEQKALYHDQLGAGKARVKRPFLALSDGQADLMRVYLQQKIDAHLMD